VDKKVNITEELLGRTVDRRFNARHSLQLLVTRWPRESVATADDLASWAERLGERQSAHQRALLKSYGVVDLLIAALAGHLSDGGEIITSKGELSPAVSAIRSLTETQLRIADRLEASSPKPVEQAVDVRALWAQASRQPGEAESGPESAEEADPGTSTSPDGDGAQAGSEASQKAVE
jgi:hypothetical protein